MATYTLIHVAISLVGIVTGLVVLNGMFGGRRLNGWTAWFLATTTATSGIGFFFPFHGFTVLVLFVVLGFLATCRFGNVVS